MSDRDFTVRRATLEDLETLVDLRMKMQGESIEVGDASVEQVREGNAAYFREALGTDDIVAVLADTSDGCVGSGVLVFNRKPPAFSDPQGLEGYILSMYTEPAWRGRGIAAAIVEFLVHAAREAGASVIGLRASDMGRPVYAKQGFAENPHFMQLWLREH